MLFSVSCVKQANFRLLNDNMIMIIISIEILIAKNYYLKSYFVFVFSKLVLNKCWKFSCLGTSSDIF